MFGIPWRRRRLSTEVHPDEIFLDAENLPSFNRDQFEGRMEQPLGRNSFFMVSVLLIGLFAAFAVQAGNLEIRQGGAFAARAVSNQLSRFVVFADRGVIVDRNNRKLAANERAEDAEYSTRVYAPYRGIAAVVGYAKPPAKDSSGTYFREESLGVDGVEAAYDSVLRGSNGLKLTETDAVGEVVSESTLVPPEHGEKIQLSIDADVSQGLYDAIARHAAQARYRGGAGVVMDIHTGELIAMVTYPEYSLQVLADGDRDAIASYLNDPSEPFLDRATQGLYSPGSTVKTVMSIGALATGVIDEYTKILSTGSITIPNPYFPDKPSVYRDWKAHGWVDMRHALSVSSDVYFYEVGGGFENQKGMGIAAVSHYMQLFGFGSATGLKGFSEAEGVVPTPEWKAEVFPDDPVWRIGNTYHTSIGQYGTQVTPLQMVRVAGAMATSGKLFTPQLLASSTPEYVRINEPEHSFQVVREGMRMSVTEGVAQAAHVGFVAIAAKTGTAQVGVRNEYINSWMMGFWPYEEPRYAFAIVLERGPADTLIGAGVTANDFFQWMHEHAPDYLAGRR